MNDEQNDQIPLVDAIENLTPDQRADRALRVVLRPQVQSIENNLAGTLTRENPEHLHDLRVAARRTRSILGQIKGVFPQTRTRRFLADFAWLGQVTSTPRDLDVYVIGFDELKALLPALLREDLEPLRAELIARRDQAYRAMFRHLGSRRYHRLITSWLAFLEQPAPRRPRAPYARQPCKGLVDRRIFKLFRRALRQGRVITPDSPAEHLHELRKTCKKLRYLIELFQPLYPADQFRATVRPLKQFQEHLGSFQDVHAQIAWLQSLAEDLRKRPSLPTRTLLAMGALLGQLEMRQAALRKDFDERFRTFDCKETRGHYRRLFRASRKSEKT